MKILFFLIPFFSSYVFLSCADSAEKPQISEESFEKLKTRATGLFEKGRTDDSISLVKEFVRQAEEEFGPDDLNLIVPREYLSRLYLKARKYAQVEKIYQRNIEILEAGLGENNPKLADYLNNLAVFYLRQKKYEQSETYLMKALNIYLKVNGETHENVVTARANIAALGEIMRIPERPKKNQKEGMAENEKKPYHTAYPFRRSVDTLIFDGAGLLGETEMEQTEKILTSIKNEGEALVFVVIVKSMASYGAVGWSPDVYAGNLLEKL
ncbi:MAG: tetratricopeptide repeat protein [Nitrospinota bacterium]